MSQPEPANDTSRCEQDERLSGHCEVIDEEGDVLLQAGTRKFLVSSKVLSLASTYFKTMFESKFREGCAMRSTSDPLILNAFDDDDPEAWALLLRIIHFSIDKRPMDIDVDMQFSVALLSDRYDCTHALYSDSLLWLQTTNKAKRDMFATWKLTAIAYSMYHRAQFDEQASQLVRISAATDLDSPMPVPSLPDTLQG